MVLELRLDGSLAIRFGKQYLKYQEIAAWPTSLGGSAPQTPRSLRIRGRRQRRQKRASPRPRRASPLAYSPPAGARVALLRSPILPTAARKIPRKAPTVQPQIIPGGADSAASHRVTT